MQKFLAVVKHEYKRIVLKWTFLIGTLLLPFIASMFAVVPALIFSIKSEPTRIALVDRTGKIAPRIKENLSPERVAAKSEEAARESLKNLDASQEEKIKREAAQFGQNFLFQDYDMGGRPIDEVRQDLTNKIISAEIDAYLIIPEDLNAPNAVFEFRSRKASDFVSNEMLEDSVNQAARSQRLADANISEAKVRELSKNIKLDTKKVDEKGDEKDSEGLMIVSFVIAMMIYIVLIIYGQLIMGAVVEEKETRIAEILFSSAKPFELMMGKLVGVGLAGLTQLSIWIGSVLAFTAVMAVGVGGLSLPFTIPEITPLMVVYFFIFFLLGFFIYASIFALIGSMVTTVQEGGQFAFPPIMILLIAFYFSFAVIRDPNSSLSFWVSIAPFIAPITMPVRILAETPPFWQIALSVFVNGVAIAGLVWLAGRVYRIGMLMYGKRATIPEVWKWIRQS